jgi:RNA polymerase sigma-70 factor, ECF subfamily
MNAMSMSPEAILKAAFQHQDALLTYTYGLTRDWALAEDIVQNAYVTVMAKCADYEEGTNLFAWVKAIVRLKALEMLRSRKRERTEADEQLTAMVDQALDRHLDENASQHQGMLMTRLMECLGRTGRSAMDLLHGFYVEGKSYAMLAQARDAELETIRKQLYRLRKQLRECAERRLQEAQP